MAYTAWSVVFGEQPSAAKWNQLGTNDAGFKDGTNIDDGAVTPIKIDLADTVFVGNLAGGPTSGTTALSVGSVTIPLQTFDCYVMASGHLTLNNDTTSDEFQFAIREGSGVGGTILGSLNHRHQAVNARSNYALTGIHDAASDTTPYTLTSGNALTLTTTIQRIIGTGTATVHVAGQLTVFLIPKAA